MMSDENKYQSVYSNQKLNNVYFDLNGNPAGLINPKNLSEFQINDFAN